MSDKLKNRQKADNRNRNKEDILAASLATCKLNFKCLWYKNISSTNLRARQIIEMSKLASDETPSPKKDPVLIVADEQTNGKGQRGRNWHSPAKSGLWFSILFYPELPLSKIPGLTIETAKAVQQFLHHTFSIKSKIKDPNDLLVNGKKICGILAESDTIAGKYKPEFVIIGTGLNIQTNFPKELSTIGTSVKEHYKGTIPPAEILIGKLISKMVEIFPQECFIPQTSMPCLCAEASKLAP